MTNFRSIIANSNRLAMGCSHTYGTAVDASDTWAYKLGAINCGVPGVSADYVARNVEELLDKHNTKVLFVLWPNWTRFEYNDGGEIKQSLPVDKNRIQFMELATDEWLLHNYTKQVEYVRGLCNIKDVTLVDMTLDDLIPHIDNADRWPLASDNMHFAPEWHNWVAEIFRNKLNDKT